VKQQVLTCLHFGVADFSLRFLRDKIFIAYERFALSCAYSYIPHWTAGAG
jgi:hypothetical protein